MPSIPSPPLRRPRADIESDGEADSLRDSQRSTPSASVGKRARTNGYQSDDESPAPEVPATNGSRRGRPDTHEEEEEDSDVETDPNDFQPGAIIRVKLTNFVTYEKAEFFPGPNLNMVIGPNGTGKSTLVCAICLGLGWGPQHLGRASQIGEFVKHGLSEAHIEIELQKRPREAFNHVVRLRIIRDGNAREWFLDGKKTSLKAVQALTASLSIQIDNLCQFLPQDKVSEFAGLSPVDLLLQTQRAAAPEEMLQMHEALKQYRKEQKSLDRQHSGDKEELERLETRQQNLHAEVLRLQERQQIQQRVNDLKKTIPFVEYRASLAEHHTFKENKKQAQKRYNELKATVDPMLHSINEKKAYASRIETVVKERKAAVTSAEREADRKSTEIDGLDEQAKTNEQKVDAEIRDNNERKKDMQKILRKITDYKAQLNDEPVQFNPAEWNERIRTKEHEIRDINNKIQEKLTRERELRDLAKACRDKKEEANQELAKLDTQEGRQLSKLEKFSPEAAEAWKWIQQNTGSFEQEVYGPPMISCSIKDPRWANAIESLFRRPDYLAFTAQTLKDMKTLSNQLHGKMGFTDITIRTSDDSRDPPLMSAEELYNLGLDGWAIDFIDGPTPVLDMLCNSVKIDKSAVTLRDLDENNYNAVLQDGRLKKWVNTTQNFQVSRRKEYGPSAISTTTRAVRPATVWTDQPVDTALRQALKDKVKTLDEEHGILKDEVLPIRAQVPELRKKITSIEAEIRGLREEKGKLQKDYNFWVALPDKIRHEENALELKRQAAGEHRDRLNTLHTQHDLAVIRKSKNALEYKNAVEKIRDCHDELLEAQIRLIEAQSDVEGLTARNEDIVRELEAEEARKNHAEEQAKIVLTRAKKALAVCKAILDENGPQAQEQEWAHPPEGLTVEVLETEIAAEESKLDYMQSNNPNAIRDYEKRQVDVDKLKEKIAATETKLEKLERQIAKVRGRWEPELDKLIAEISEAFSFNFERIGCAGSVSVHKDDDFDLWAIQIKVKFRQNEDLQLLDAHRQSGGERSVSTIFYLMSLQSLARAPFRVVDEINQGMDPRNERMVHERMVEIACQTHTSQYFLITPKLLTGLKYDKRMKVLCIASGEHMPENYQKLDVSKIIGIRRAIMASG